MTQAKRVLNAAGREVPTQVNGQTQTPYMGVGKYSPSGRRYAPRIVSCADFPPARLANVVLDGPCVSILEESHTYTSNPASMGLMRNKHAEHPRSLSVHPLRRLYRIRFMGSPHLGQE